MMFWLQIVLSNVLVASAICALAMFVGRSGRNGALAHGLWLLFFIKLITPPIIFVAVDLPEHRWQALSQNLSVGLTSSIPLESAREGATSIANLDAAQNVSSHFQFNFIFDPWIWLSIGWITGLSWLLARGLIRFKRFQDLVASEGKCDEAATLYVRDLLSANARSGKTSHSLRTPQVMRMPMSVSPMLFGFGRRAVIVVPDPLWQTLQEQERHVLLAHEAAHYARRDHLGRWLEWLVTAIYWWFPLVYLARKQLERHEESCCDACAVRWLKVEPKIYGQSLLQVVDFVAENRGGLPRLASGMKPTDSLAERLMLLMRRQGSPETSAIARYVVGCTALLFLICHPYVRVVPAAANTIQTSLEQFKLPTAERVAPLLVPSLDENAGPLPEIPTGFWNHSPSVQWANEELSLKGAKLVADAKQGIRIEIPGEEPIRFAANELTAIVDLASTHRLIIGDSSGRIRLWDLAARKPVSLIGKHNDSVSSLAEHVSTGLFSADIQGTVIRWDSQSGIPLATWNAKGAVQSIRVSRDGQTLAVLVNQWNHSLEESAVHLLSADNLQPIQRILVPDITALVMQHEQLGWISVLWNGEVRDLWTRNITSVIPKLRVSSLVLSQEVPLLPAAQEHSTSFKGVAGLPALPKEP